MNLIVLACESLGLGITISSVISFPEDGLEVVRSVWDTLSLEEFVLELNPMESKCVKEALEIVHAHQHSERNTEEYVVHWEQLNHLNTYGQR